MSSGLKRHSSCSAPVAPESPATKAIAPACPEEIVFLSLAPWFRPAPNHPPWQTPARLPRRRPDLWEPASKPVKPPGELRQDCRTQLRAAQQLPPRLHRSPCCPLEWRSPSPAWSIPAPCADDRHMLRYRMPAKNQNFRSQSLRQTTFAAPPFRR